MAINLITGANGFIGANLTRHLLSLGEQVHVFIRPGSDLWRLKDVQDGLSIYYVDLVNGKLVEELIFKIKPDHVFHLAHYGGNRGQTDILKINEVIIDGSKNIYHSCQKLGIVRSIINAGSYAEYGPKNEIITEKLSPKPLSDYGKAKLQVTLYGEKLRKNYQMPITTLRFFNVYGPYESGVRLIPAIILNLTKGIPPSLSNPKAVLDFVYVKDVVDALVLATTKPFGVYNIGTGVETSLLEVVSFIQSELKIFYDLVWGGDSGRGSESVSCRADISLAEEVLGWKPKVYLRAGVAMSVDWFKRYGFLYEKNNSNT